MLADTDAGNVVTGAQAGARWGYRLLPLLLALIPLLYMVQELAVRLAIHTGRSHSELIRERFGVGWAKVSLIGLAAASIGTLVTEFTGVAPRPSQKKRVHTASALPEHLRLHSLYLWLVTGLSAVTVLLGLYGGVWGLL